MAGIFTSPVAEPGVEEAKKSYTSSTGARTVADSLMRFGRDTRKKSQKSVYFPRSKFRKQAGATLNAATPHEANVQTFSPPQFFPVQPARRKHFDLNNHVLGNSISTVSITVSFSQLCLCRLTQPSIALQSSASQPRSNHRFHTCSVPEI